MRPRRPDGGAQQRVVRAQQLEPVEHLLGGGHRRRILAMRQIVARATIAVAERRDGAMHRLDAHLHTALALEQRLQVADAPDRDGQVVGLWTLFQCRGEERPIGQVQLGGPPTP
jgi:hypothetical protein